MHLNRKLFLLTLLILANSSLVLAEDDVDTKPILITQGTQHDVALGCSLEGWFCTTSTLCNITISYPNSSRLVDNKAMTLNGALANYTLNPAQTSLLGIYPTNVKCNHPPTGQNGSTDFNIYITPNGKLLEDNGENWILLGAALLFIILGLVFLIMALRVPPGAVKIFTFVLGCLLLIGSLMVTINLLQNYVANNQALTTGVERIFYLLIVVGFAAFILLLVFTVILVLKYLKHKARFSE